MSIVLGLPDFIGFKLDAKHKKVIYVSTEEDPISVSPSIKRQINAIKQTGAVGQESDLSNTHMSRLV